MPGQKPVSVLKDRGGIVTTVQVECWRQRLKTEAEIVAPQVEREMAKIGDLHKPNNYLHYYKAADQEDRFAHEFTYDQVFSGSNFDAKANSDTIYPPHLFQRDGFKSSRPVRTSQAYGWLKPIDIPGKRHA